MKIKSIGIIGYGDFGRFIAQITADRFPDVTVKIASASNPIDGKLFFPFDEVCKADLLFPCVPISAFRETITKITPYLGESTIVCDVATVKKHTIESMRAAGIPRFIATHPMFGPYSYAKLGNSLTGLRIAICDSTLPEEDLQKVIELLEAAGLNVLRLTADDHDRLVAETLFLTHLVGQTVSKGGFERTSIDTVSFGFLMDAVESVAHDEKLFRDVYNFNSYCKQVLERYKTSERTVESSLGL